MSGLTRRMELSAAAHRARFVPVTRGASKEDLRRMIAEAAANTQAHTDGAGPLRTVEKRRGPPMLIPWSPIAGPLCYLASPFTHYPRGYEQAESDVARIAGHLIAAGVRLFCPIAHSGPLVRHGKLDPIDQKLWRVINAPFVALCSVLIVARLEGWGKSKGIADETFDFRKRGAPIFDLCPKSLVMTRRP